MNRSGLKTVLSLLIRACSMWNGHVILIIKVLDWLKDNSHITEDQYNAVRGTMEGITGVCAALEFVRSILDTVDF